MKKEHVSQIIKSIRPSALFVEVSHSQEFIEENTLREFFYVSLYDLNIDSNFLLVDDANIILHNSYLQSFIYNLSNCWLYFHHGALPENTPGKEALLRYNLKKFYAEQLYREKNCIFSRALLLETLLYEQHDMVEVIKVIEADERFRKLSILNYEMASSLISAHELAHVYLNRDADLSDSLLEEKKEYLLQISSDILAFQPEFQIEIKCDLFALFSTIDRFQSEIDMSTLLNMLIFNYASIFVMYSLKQSAELTIEDNRDIINKENVEFSSIIKSNVDYNYSIMPDLSMVGRVRIMINVCLTIAEKDGITLAPGTAFPVSGDIIGYFSEIVDTIMDGNAIQRGMAMLLAKAFDGHPAGFEYLYLNSRQFKSNRPGFSGL